MKNLRIFGLIGLVIYTILLMMACGRGPDNDSTSNDLLNTISSLSSSIIKTIKGTTPILTHIKSPSLQENNLVSFKFRSSKAGTISYSGNCFGSTKNAIKGDHHILLGAMVEGNYDNCAIQVTDLEGNTSEPLQVPSFRVDFSAPELSQVWYFNVQVRNVDMEIKAPETGILNGLLGRRLGGFITFVKASTIVYPLIFLPFLEARFLHALIISSLEP